MLEEEAAVADAALVDVQSRLAHQAEVLDQVKKECARNVKQLLEEIMAKFHQLQRESDTKSNQVRLENAQKIEQATQAYESIAEEANARQDAAAAIKVKREKLDELVERLDSLLGDHNSRDAETKVRIRQVNNCLTAANHAHR